SAGILTSHCFAQDLRSCDELLKHGIYDFLSESGASSNRSAASNEICSTYSSHKSRNSAGQTEGHYTQLFNGSLSLSDTQLENLGQSMCSRNDQSFDAAHFAQVNQAVISGPAVNAWQACVTQVGKGNLFVTTDFQDTDQGTTGVVITFHQTGATSGTNSINYIN